MFNLSCSALYTENDQKECDEVVNRPGFSINGHSVNYHNGNIYLFGGYDGSKRTNDLWILHNAKNISRTEETYEYEERPQWTKKTLKNITGRAGHQSFILDNKLYIHAGYDTQHNVLADMIEIQIDTKKQRKRKRRRI